MEPEGPRKLIFVGGAPRSGTTVTHALLCTGEGVSRYHPEISFFRGLLSAYGNGKAAWDQHTSAFFADREAFRRLMRETTDLSIQALWRALGSPEILCMKDPHLTPWFRLAHELYPAEAWFVTVCRDPCAVVRSRQAVHDRSTPDRPFGMADASAVAQEYLAYYRSVLGTDFGGRHFMFRYEDLNTATLREKLAQFVGVPGFDTRLMWRMAGDLPIDEASHAAVAADPWGSPKYHGPIDLEPRLEPLAPELAATVRRICQPIMARFGYS